MAAVDIADVIGERYPRPSYARTNGVCLLAPKPIRRTAVSPRLSRLRSVNWPLQPTSSLGQR